MAGIGKRKPVIITREDGSEQRYESGVAAARAEQLPQAAISEMCRGFMSNYKGKKARFEAPVSQEPTYG